MLHLVHVFSVEVGYDESVEFIFFCNALSLEKILSFLLMHIFMVTTWSRVCGGVIMDQLYGEDCLCCIRDSFKRKRKAINHNSNSPYYDRWNMTSNRETTETAIK